jgi:hypothetical protein
MIQKILRLIYKKNAMRNKTIIFLCLVLAGLFSQAQESRTVHFMQFNPYSNLLNPAAPVKYKGYVGMPFMSNIHLNVENTGIQYDHLIKINETGKTLTINNFIDHLHKTNRLNLNLNLEIFSFGFKTKHLFVTVSDRIKTDAYLFYPKTLFKLPLQGNMNYIDEPAEFNNLAINANIYNELGVGFRYQINDQWAIGFKPKFLIGLANIKTNSSHFKLTTNPNNYDLTMEENFSVNTSLPVDIENIDDFDVKTLKNIINNMGFAIDLGVQYQINEKWSVGAAVSDLGFIHWETYPTNYESHTADGGRYYRDGQFYFSGVDVAQLVDNKEYMDEFVDSLASYFPTNQTKLTSYNSATYAKVVLEGRYQIHRNHAFSAMFRGDIINRFFIPSLTVAWDGMIANFLNLCVNYTIMPHSYANVGVGIGFAFNGFQMYLATDNVLAAFDVVNSRQVGLQAGIVFNWGKQKITKPEQLPEEKPIN